MLTLPEITSLVAATKSAIDLFDKYGGQIKSVLMPDRPKEPEGTDEKWGYKVGTNGNDIVVKSGRKVIQTITGDELAKKLSRSDLVLVQTYERKMEQYFRQWTKVYEAKDSSPDPLVDAKVDEQLEKLVIKMRSELIGILEFLQKIGVHLDDHYMHIRNLVKQAGRS